MHFGIDSAIVGLLIHNESFRASLHNWHVIFHIHRAHLDRDGRKIRRERAYAFSQITVAYKFWMFAGHQENLSKPLAREMPPFGDHFVHIKRNAKDWIVAGEPAIPAVVDAFVGQIKRRKETHRTSKILKSE